jgi:REP element-mobilizing transposase RayT
MTYYERNLPHWHPPGRAIFVTWRLNGSLPEHVLVAIQKSKQTKGRQFARAERFLDKAAYGPLWLSQPEIAACVTNAILKGERELSRFKLLAWAVMPNHVHLLIEPLTPLKAILNGIKGASARDANLLLGRVGQTFWQSESFDHWVRTPAEGERICRYIENNPVKAGLVSSIEQWRWSSAAKQ